MKEVPGFNARFRCLLFHFGTNKEVANSQWLPIRRKWEMLAWRDLDLGPIFFERGGPTDGRMTAWALAALLINTEQELLRLLIGRGLIYRGLINDSMGLIHGATPTETHKGTHRGRLHNDVTRWSYVICWGYMRLHNEVAHLVLIQIHWVKQIGLD